MIEVVGANENLSALVERLGDTSGALYIEHERRQDDLMRSAIPVVAEQTVHGSPRHRIIATACLLSFQKRLFLVTAQHVREQFEGVALAIPDSCKPGARRFLSFGILADRGNGYSITSSDAIDVDLWFCEIQPRFIADLLSEWKTISIEDLVAPDKLRSQSYVAAGYCGKQPRYDGAWTLKTKLLNTYSLPVESYQKLGCDPESQLLLSIGGPMSDGKGTFKTTLPSLRGMSGGPVWNVPNAEQHLCGKRFLNFSGIVIGSPTDGVMSVTSAPTIVFAIGRVIGVV